MTTFFLETSVHEQCMSSLRSYTVHCIVCRRLRMRSTAITSKELMANRQIRLLYHIYLPIGLGILMVATSIGKALQLQNNEKCV